MCGVCGIINFNDKPVNKRDLQAMMDKMRHRGPDDEGLFIDGNVGFGFVRLSIIDLSYAGHQPMVDESGRYIIVFNGEIYNYIEIRDVLKTKGYSFLSGTDTEVLLYAFIEWGNYCLHKFNGMWAFAIFDKLDKTLFIARDRFGVKPLYYYLDNNKFIFCSEIPPILSVNETKPEPNNQVIYHYLVFNRIDYDENTFFRGIRKLQHGHFVKINNSKISFQKWYDLKNNLKEPFSGPEEYRDLLSSAIGLRLRSDVPIGVCLSGGLDSSSIVSILKKDYNLDKLNSFSAIYGKGVRGDEYDFINDLSHMLGNMFFVTPTAQSLYEDLDLFVNLNAEPVPDTSPYAQFKVMQLAKDHIVVTLDGQGADEQLAGYHYFFGFLFKEFLLNARPWKLVNEIYNYLLNHKSSYGLKSLLYFLIPTYLKTKSQIIGKKYIQKDFINSYTTDNFISGKLYGSNSLNEALLNHFEYKLEHLLKWEDRNSMCFSLEARVPFLDYRLVEKSLSLPSENIMRNGMTKHILREATKGLVPEKIRMRKDKIGFGTPEDDWLRTNIFRGYILDLLNSDKSNNRGYIKSIEAIRLYRKHLNKSINISKDIWKWVNLELWFNIFIDSHKY
jgi:asparagine synthase (glutamine-hydrolysing)